MPPSLDTKNEFKDIVEDVCLLLVDHINSELKTSENEYEFESHFKPYYTYMKVEGSGGSIPTVKTIDIGYSYELIKPVFNSLPSDTIEFLERNKFFTKNNYTNIYHTKFGKFVINYIEALYEFEDEYPTGRKFHQELFDVIFEDTWKAYFSDKVEIQILYPIFGSKFNGTSFLLDDKNDFYFMIPTDNDKTELTKRMKVRTNSSHILGGYKLISWVTDLSAWIEGSVLVDRNEFDQDISDPNHSMYSPSISLIPSKLIQEAFHILGNNIEVLFYSWSTPLSHYRYQIEPIQNGVLKYMDIGAHHPGWAENFRMRFPKGTININDKLISFMRLYPSMRLDLDDQTLEFLLFNKYSQLQQMKTYFDQILNSVIILESILIEGNNELALQLRQKVAWGLGRDYNERKFLYEITKRLYNIRSKIVHEAGHVSSSMSKSLNWLGGTPNAAKIAKEITRLLLLKLIRIQNNKLFLRDRNKINNKLDEIILGSGEKLDGNHFYENQIDAFFENLKEIVPKNHWINILK